MPKHNDPNQPGLWEPTPKPDKPPVTPAPVAPIRRPLPAPPVRPVPPAAGPTPSAAARLGLPAVRDRKPAPVPRVPVQRIAAPVDVSALWDINQVAAYLGVPKETIYRWRKAGSKYGPVGFRVGKHLRWNPQTVIAWAQEQERFQGHGA